MSQTLCNDGSGNHLSDRKGRILEEMKERLMEREVGPHTGYGLFLSKEILSITGMTVTRLVIW
jgi:hypothetical protein